MWMLRNLERIGRGECVAAVAEQLAAEDEKVRDAARRALQNNPAPEATQALAAVLAEEPETVEDVYEPFLLRLGFLDRTPQGRIATDGARQHLARLGFDVPPPRRGDADQPALWDGTSVADGPAGTDAPAG
jgi:hypothetical protein